MPWTNGKTRQRWLLWGVVFVLCWGVSAEAQASETKRKRGALVRVAQKEESEGAKGPSARRPPTPREKPTSRKTSTLGRFYERVKKRVTSWVPESARKRMEKTRQKFRDAYAVYQALQRLFGEDEETKKKRAKKRARERIRDRWAKKDKAIEERLRQRRQRFFWRKACGEGSARACRALLKEHPKEVELLSRLKQILYHRKLFRQLLPICRQLVQLAPKEAEHRLCYARALEAHKRYGEAQKVYEQGVLARRDHADTWLAWGWFLLRRKQEGEAETACRQAIYYRPKDGRAWYCLGKSLKPGPRPKNTKGEELPLSQEEEKRRQQAQKEAFGALKKACSLGMSPACKEALALRPRNPLSWLRLGGRMAGFQWSSSSTTILRYACRLGASSACERLSRRYRKQARWFLRRKLYFRAELLYRRAVKMSPNNAKSLRELGLFLLSRGRMELACDFLEKALQANPKDGATWRHLARCRKQQAQQLQEQIRSTYQRACALGDQPSCKKISNKR